MEKIKVYNYGHTQLKENFYEILKEISEIRPHTTFSKDQEEEFLKDAIVVFEYLKAGIDIKSSEILINNGKIPLSCLEKIFLKFSKKLSKEENKTFIFHIHRNEEGNLVKIYEFQDCEKEDLTRNSDKLSERKPSLKRNILLVNAGSYPKKDSMTKTRLKKIIDYALKNDIILLYDATSSKESKDFENVKSIYEIENAKKVAIEFKRFASVDNTKETCGYLVVPECLKFPATCRLDYDSYKIKDILKEEIAKGSVSMQSLKNSFLNYACS